MHSTLWHSQTLVPLYSHHSLPLCSMYCFAWCLALLRSHMGAFASVLSNVSATSRKSGSVLKCSCSCWLSGASFSTVNMSLTKPVVACHNRDTWSTLYHSVRSRPRIYHLFHCMYLHSPIISILFVSPPIGECFVWSVFPYNFLICFCLWSQLLSVPILLYLLIRYASGNRPQTSPGLLIVLRELCWSSACLTPRALPRTFYNSI